MQLRIGNFFHPVAEAAISFRKEAMVTKSGLQYGMKERWSISGFAQQDTTALLVAELNLIEGYYSVDHQDVALIANDGVSFIRKLPGRTPLGGTIVRAGPSYPDDGSTNAVLTTFRDYKIEVEGVYPLIQGTANILLSWYETVHYKGTGGPRFVLLQPTNGPPIRQQVAEQTPLRAMQAGTCTGLYDYWPAAAPLWPADEHKDLRDIEDSDPEREGGSGAPIYTNFTRKWSYQFEGTVLTKLGPTFWP